jgi:probable F420-dependent oxidoreductase
MAGFDFGRVGVWTRDLDRLPMSDSQAAAAELEALGYGTLWVPEVIGREPFASAALMLSATSQLVVGTGMANIYARSATAMNAGWKTLTEAFPDRFVLGLGTSNPAIVEGMHGGRYGPPYTTLVRYLDAMERAVFVAKRPKTEARLVLAALRPRLMGLAAERGIGAMSYFVPVDHTRSARAVLGEGPSLLVEQAAVIDPDPETARATARRYMATYLGLPIYTDVLRALGWSDDDIAGPSDALVDAVVAWGTPHGVASRIREHLDAGADHVAVQMVPGDPKAVPLAEYRALAGVLPGI